MSSRTCRSQGRHDPRLHRRRHGRAGDGARRRQQPRHADQDPGDRRLRGRAGHLRQAPRLARDQAAGRPPREGGRRGGRACCKEFHVARRRRSRSSSRATSSAWTRSRSASWSTSPAPPRARGFSGVIKRHNFSSNRASHGNSRSHNTPGSIGMAQDPGRVFPGKRMAGQLRQRDAHGADAQGRPRRRRARPAAGQGLRCPAPTAATSIVRPSVKTPRARRGPDDGTQAHQRQRPADRDGRGVPTRCSAATTTRR